MSSSSSKSVNFYPFWPENRPAPAFKPVFMETEAYAQAITNMVVVCADVIFYQPNGKIWLAKRKAKPMNTWWLCGGRVNAGELPEDAMLRKLKAETSLEISADRLHFMGLNRYLFPNRQQPPQDTPCDSLCYTYSLEISDAEIASVSSHLNPQEYEGAALQGFTAKDLQAGEFHPVLHHLHRMIFPTQS